MFKLKIKEKTMPYDGKYLVSTRSGHPSIYKIVWSRSCLKYVCNVSNSLGQITDYGNPGHTISEVETYIKNGNWIIYDNIEEVISSNQVKNW